MLTMSLAAPVLAFTASAASAETRSLKVYFVHTKEKATITFKRNGRYDQKGLQELNRFLRDWRRNQPTKMDPRLFDLVWEVYRRTGAKDYIHVVSAYRSPETNGMLRSRSAGVAKNSQHTLGKAMDFYIPGVKLTTLREVAMQLQVGGVGYYPKSGSPFVHLDVGGVRAWPRMSRQELVRIFPDGKTVHIPSDGKPLPGYQQALADYKKRSSASSIQVASTAADPAPRKKKNLLTALFGGGDEDEDADAIAAPAPAARPAPAAPAPVVADAAPVQVAALPENANINAPIPLSRPSFREEPAAGGLATALYSPARNAAQDALQAALPAEPQPVQQGTDFADLQGYSIPVPTLLGPRRMNGDAETDVMTASVGGAGLSQQEFALVPTPANRPTAAEALLANADIESEADEIEQAVLSADLVAALERSGNDARAAQQPAETARTPITRDQAGATQVAALAPAPRPAVRAASFGDAFDAPQAALDNGIGAGLPAKGGRPKKEDAETARRAMSGGGQLTGDKLAQWALSKNRVDAAPKAMKAPRVINRNLLATEPSVSYTVGFRKQEVAVDPSRFSGVSPVRQ